MNWREGQHGVTELIRSVGNSSWMPLGSLRSHIGWASEFSTHRAEAGAFTSGLPPSPGQGLPHGVLAPRLFQVRACVRITSRFLQPPLKLGQRHPGAESDRLSMLPQQGAAGSHLGPSTASCCINGWSTKGGFGGREAAWQRRPVHVLCTFRCPAQ